MQLLLPAVPPLQVLPVARVGVFCCRPIVEAFRRQHALDPRWRAVHTIPSPSSRPPMYYSLSLIPSSHVPTHGAAPPGTSDKGRAADLHHHRRIPESLHVQLQRSQQRYPACVDLPYILRELRILGAFATLPKASAAAKAKVTSI